MLLFKELLPRELLKLIPWVKLLLPLGAPLVLIASVGTWPRDDPVLVCRVCCFKIGVWSRGRKEKKEEERGKKEGKKEGRKKGERMLAAVGRCGTTRQIKICAS